MKSYLSDLKSYVRFLLYRGRPTYGEISITQYGLALEIEKEMTD